MDVSVAKLVFSETHTMGLLNIYKYNTVTKQKIEDV